MYRYAVVLFGGDGVLEKPRIVVQAKEVFTTASNVGKHLASLPTGLFVVYCIVCPRGESRVLSLWSYRLLLHSLCSELDGIMRN